MIKAILTSVTIERKPSKPKVKPELLNLLEGLRKRIEQDEEDIVAVDFEEAPDASRKCQTMEDWMQYWPETEESALLMSQVKVVLEVDSAVDGVDAVAIFYDKVCSYWTPTTFTPDEDTARYAFLAVATRLKRERDWLSDYVIKRIKEWREKARP